MSTADRGKSKASTLGEITVGARKHIAEGLNRALIDFAVFCEFREAIGGGLNVPVVSKSPEEAATHFGWLAMFVGRDVTGSSALTQQRLGWRPTGPRLLADLERMNYEPDTVTACAAHRA